MRHQRATLRRYVVHLTRAERDAAMEALAERLAGSIEDHHGHKRSTYESAETALSKAVLRSV